MRVGLLIDTHVMVWWGKDDPRLERSAIDAIAAAGAVYVSIASVWEIAIKRGLGKLSAPILTREWLDGEGFELLPVTLEHAREVGRLPFHHKDPFDRMLIAQARVERLVLVTNDRQIGRYDVPIIWS